MSAMRLVGVPPVAVNALIHPQAVPPDLVLYGASIFGTSYSNPTGFNNYGNQATFDILSDGETDQGLRVTIARAQLSAINSNGVSISVTVGNSRSATLSAANKTVTIVLTASTTLGQIKSTIDAATGLSSVYFGGGASGNATDAQEVADTSNATADSALVVECRTDQEGLLFAGTAAPANDNGSQFFRGVYPLLTVVPAGQLPWITAVGNTARKGSVRAWKV